MVDKIPNREKEVLLRFIERNVKNGPDPNNPDEGIGTVYERIVIDEYFRKIQDRYKLKSVIESPADGVTGVPGINSLEFAKHGQARVVLCNPSQLMIDGARVVWEKKKLMDYVDFIKCEIDSLPLADDSFDLAWNYCMFERFSNPEIIVRELKRVSRKYVMVMTQNKNNLGTLVHWIYHRFNDLEWDHGSTKLMSMPAIKKVFKDNDLEIIETGTIDTPPWLDTWDMPLRGELKGLLGRFGMKWEWKNEKQASGSAADSKLIKFSVWLEKNLPDWFAKSQTHHYYVLARK